MVAWQQLWRSGLPLSMNAESETRVHVYALLLEYEYKYLIFCCAKCMMDDVTFAEKSYCRLICLFQGRKTDRTILFYGFVLKPLHWNNSFYLLEFFIFLAALVKA